MLLIGYFEGIASERASLGEAHSFALRDCLGVGLDSGRPITRRFRGRVG
jgi:hypothetical protein